MENIMSGNVSIKHYVITDLEGNVISGGYISRKTAEEMEMTYHHMGFFSQHTMIKEVPYEYITSSMLKNMLEEFDKNQKCNLHLDNYFTQEGDKFLGIANETGDLFIEEFNSANECFKYLAGKKCIDSHGIELNTLGAYNNAELERIEEGMIFVFSPLWSSNNITFEIIEVKKTGNGEHFAVVKEVVLNDEYGTKEITIKPYQIEKDCDGVEYIKIRDNNNTKFNLYSKYSEKREENTIYSSNRDYGPSNPWDAPGMSIRNFI